MADDLNADKAMEALNHASTNFLYQALIAQPLKRPIDLMQAKALERVADQIDALERRSKLTAMQRKVVANQLENPLFLVQGPPGTGKSQTLAWAVLARTAVAASLGQGYRVAVSCKTHNAVNILLEAIAAKRPRLSSFATSLTRGLQTLQVFKLVNDDAEAVPDGVERLNPYSSSPRALEALLARPSVVIGGTPGGFYNLGRYRSRTKKVDWDQKPFELLVIDEASQMSIPESILASAFLKLDGTEIVVGDHRQMPPIIAHTWEEEQRRAASLHHPYLSLFESLLDRGFPRVGLDESFRLHETLAEFLHQNIYRRDGIHFHSKRKEVTGSNPATDPYVRSVMQPEYPIVVIEHGEMASQQYNPTELELIAPLIDLCANYLRLDGRNGIGVVVPHRAQKTLLRARFPDLAVLDSIDTVERFQGGERDVIIVSATASDPDYVLSEASFLLDLNRLNVALSRPRKKLIVIASRAVIELLTSDLEIFENAVIWKRLYYQWTPDLLWHGTRAGFPVTVRGHRAKS